MSRDKVRELVKDIGMQRLLQELIDDLAELEQECIRDRKPAHYISLLKVDLGKALDNYLRRHEYPIKD